MVRRIVEVTSCKQAATGEQQSEVGKQWLGDEDSNLG
jgi:hypothetical protein